MPWRNNNELPDSVRSVLPDAAQTRWRQVANSRLAAGDSEESAIRQAWHVVGLGWKKPKDGTKWVRKIGARHTRKEYEQIQQLHDLAVSLGATCKGDNEQEEEELDYDDYEDNDYEDKGFNKADRPTFFKAESVSIDEQLGLVFGYGIVCKINGEPYFDSQGDHIPEDAMLKAATDFMQHSRVALEMHRGDKIGDVVFSFPLTTDIAKALGIKTPKTGWLVAIKPPKDVLAKYKSGEYTGFSIGGQRVVDEDVG